MARIRYSGFWDRPLGFVVAHQGSSFFFTREFDEAIDEYEDTYRVFLLPDGFDVTSEQGIPCAKLEQIAVGPVATVPVVDVQFDQSYRKEIDTAILDKLRMEGRD